MSVVFSAATTVCSALLCAGIIALIRPWLQRYALAQPNARSSHTVPTPQGGGIAVVAAAIVISYVSALFLAPGDAGVAPPILLAVAAIVMAAIGVTADLHPIGVVPRLVLQALVVAAAIYALPADMRVLPFLPWWLERALLVIGGVWFVNLVNFMDGLDWITAAEAVPIMAAIAVIGLLGVVPAQTVIMSLAFGGAMIGFGYFNRPVAQLFLGDVGSLPLGLVLGWMLVVVAGHGGHAAALLLPLYYLADSTITLARRLLNGEPVWQAHRTHFYQRATNNGFSVIDVVTRVFAVNLALCVLALATVTVPGHSTTIVALLAGAALVAWLLVTFARAKKTTA
jgi:UDP-N-acetylmuramyl pentapeptide phosphotransferase/UDP-N-acetylglucosamine-1-phosphate transferase